MSSNPLQKYFRQPRIFIRLPSQGIYNHNTAIDGDVNNLPVYGMTGMDEILLKTADALISGESTARVIGSCCPNIIDPWNVSMLDIDVLLASIRIATYGNNLEVSRVCGACETENNYTINLSDIIEFFGNCQYNNTVKVGDLTVTIRPLTYKQSTEFAMRNFDIQRRVVQIGSITDDKERIAADKQILADLTLLRLEIFSSGIESIAIGSEVVTDERFIKEWINNSDKKDTETINNFMEKIKEAWTPSKKTVVCENCGAQEEISVELDQSNFFVNA